jgi:hypothetical protein
MGRFGSAILIVGKEGDKGDKEEQGCDFKQVGQVNNVCQSHRNAALRGRFPTLDCSDNRLAMTPKQA